MRVISQKPIPLAGIKDYVESFEEKKELELYLKKFGKLGKAKAGEFAKEIEGLGNVKIKERDIVKIIDFLPRNSEEVNKIFTDVSLSEEETNAILEIVGKY